MAMVLDGRSALTRGLMVVSTASALTVAILALHFCGTLALRIKETNKPSPKGTHRRRRGGRGRLVEAAKSRKGTAAQAAHLENETEPVPGEALVGMVKDGVEVAIGAAARFLLRSWLVAARWLGRWVILFRLGRGEVGGWGW
jgi:hypothetical protein